MSKVISLDQIAQGGEQGWADVPKLPRTWPQKVAVLLILNAWLWLVIWRIAVSVKKP